MENKNIILSNIILMLKVKYHEDPSYNNMMLFINFTKQIIDSDFCHINESIILCFTTFLKAFLDVKVCEKSLEICLSTLAELIENKNIQICEKNLREFLNILSCLISLPTQSSIQLKNLPDEIKINILKCIHVLFDQVKVDVLIKLYQPDNLPLFGHIITLLLLILEKEKFRNLKRMSLICLQDVFCVSGRQNEYSEIDLKNCSSKMVSFLPGVSIHLVKFLTSITSEGDNITCLAIKSFYKIVGFLFPDKYILLASSKHECDVKKILNFQGNIAYSLKVESNINVNSVVVNNNIEDSVAINSVKVAELLVIKDEKWILSTGEKLYILLRNFESIIHSNTDNSKIQIGILQMAQYFLENCLKSLRLSGELLLSFLLCGFISSNPDVYKYASSILQHLKSNLQNDFEELLDSSLTAQLDNLSVYLNAPDHLTKIKCLKLLRSHLTFYLNPVSQLDHQSLGERILPHILQLISFNLTAIPLAENCDIDIASFSSINFNSWIELSLNPEISIQIAIILNIFGYHGNLDYVVNLVGDGTFSKEVELFALSQLLIGFSHRNLIEDFEINMLETMGQRLISSESFYSHCTLKIQKLNLDNSHSYSKLKFVTAYNSNSRSSILQERNDILIVSLMLDVLSSISKCFKKDLSPFLSFCLYPVLEKIGSSNVFLSRCAFATLLNFKNNMVDNPSSFKEGTDKLNNDMSVFDTLNFFNSGGLISHLKEVKNNYLENNLEGAKNLLENNLDYLFSSILLRLKKLSRHANLLVVLRVIVTLAREKTLPFIFNIFEPIISALDLHYMHKSIEFAQLFNSILQQIITQLAGQICGLNSTNNSIPTTGININGANGYCTKGDENKDHWNLEQQINKFLEIKSISSQDLADEISQYILNIHSEFIKNYNDNDYDDNFENDQVHEYEDKAASDDECEDKLRSLEEKKVLSPEINITMKILDRCQHLLSLSDPQIKMLILELISKSSIILKDHQNEYLPLLHKVWKPFVLRFSDKELYIPIKAIEILKVISEAAGDFVRRRVAQDVLPKFLNLLEKNVLISLNKSPSYSFTFNCRLQRSLLANIGHLCLHADIKGMELNKVCDVCSKYLDPRQPLSLQQAAVQCFEALIKLDYSVVWLHIHKLRKS